MEYRPWRVLVSLEFADERTALRFERYLKSSAEDAGRVAQASGVTTLVLSHLVPADDPEVTDRMWIEAAQLHFRGTVILGKDLLVI